MINLNVKLRASLCTLTTSAYTLLTLNSAATQYLHQKFEDGFCAMTSSIDTQDTYWDYTYNPQKSFKVYKDGWGKDQYLGNGPGDPRYHWLSPSNPYKGSKSYAVNLTGSDTSSGLKDRYEFTAIHHNDSYAMNITSSSSRFFGFAIYFPSQFEIPIARLIISQAWQWHAGGGKHPPLKIEVKRNEPSLKLEFFKTDENDTAPLPIYTSGILAKNTWHTLIFEMLPSYAGDGYGGRANVWINNTNASSPTFTFNGDWGYKPASQGGASNMYETFDIRVGIYRTPQNRNHYMKFDQIKYGTTFNSARPWIQ